MNHIGRFAAKCKWVASSLKRLMDIFSPAISPALDFFSSSGMGEQSNALCSTTSKTIPIESPKTAKASQSA